MGVSIGIERIFSILEAQAQVLFENVYYLCQTFCSQTSYYHHELGTVVGMVRKKICTHLQDVHGCRRHKVSFGLSIKPNHFFSSLVWVLVLSPERHLVTSTYKGKNLAVCRQPS